MAEAKIVELYGGKIKVEFNPARHQYLVNGEKKISVTGATGMLDKPALKFWSVKLMREFLQEQLNAGNGITSAMIEEGAKQHTLKTAKEATSGTLVHEWAEQYIKGMNPPMPADDRVVNGVMAFLDWVHEHKIKFLDSEKIIYSVKHDYVGILDCKFTMGIEKHKITHLGDFKTSSGIYPEMRAQVSAYQEADAEESGCEYGDKWIVRFDKDTGVFEAKSFPLVQHKDDLAMFLGLLAVKKCMVQLAE